MPVIVFLGILMSTEKPVHNHQKLQETEMSLINENKTLPCAGGHTCNPSYSGGRDQEDNSSNPAPANISSDLISKKPITKIGLVELLKMKTLYSNPSTQKSK
jgi:hypothetical protein